MIPIYSWKGLEIGEYLRKILRRDSGIHPEAEAAVSSILSEVRQHGDAAVLDLTRKYDDIELDRLRIDPAEIEMLAAKADPEMRGILRTARENIRRFHEHQVERSWEFSTQDGVRLGQRVSPLRSVGLYVPGGKAAYPSTVLMSAIPAQIAGVSRIVVTTPLRQFQQNPIVAAVLKELELTEVYGIGGAQAIAALAYGTETIPRVDKIVGPGNLYVTIAKRQVFGAVDIDMIAGPSEVVVLADDSTNPDFVAADLMAQAEHDENACSIAITTSQELGLHIQASLEKLIKKLKRGKIIRKSLENFGSIILVKDWDEAVEATNAIAPEHLELLLPDAETLAAKIHSAGAIFFGTDSCESVGDYFAGPNHVLPTSGTARFASPLGVYNFLKRTSLIHYTREALQRNHELIERFALSEDLDAHALSVRVRV
jgi:histidinol dehydrogenase